MQHFDNQPIILEIIDHCETRLEDDGKQSRMFLNDDVHEIDITDHHIDILFILHLIHHGLQIVGNQLLEVSHKDPHTDDTFLPDEGFAMLGETE